MYCNWVDFLDVQYNCFAIALLNQLVYTRVLGWLYTLIILTCISQQYFSAVFLNCISQRYLSTVFLNCISQLVYTREDAGLVVHHNHSHLRAKTSRAQVAFTHMKKKLENALETNSNLQISNLAQVQT